MISIPNPCNEDFDKMTKTERGAFCGKCETDTFDFRSLSNNEIVQIVEDNKGQHVCGRFTKGQLKDLNSGFLAWKNQSTRTFQSKFLLACVLAFGLGLFSCETEDAAVIESIQTEQVTQGLEPQIAHINNAIDIMDVDLLDMIEPVEAYELTCVETAGVIREDYETELSGDIAYVREDYILGGVIAYNDPIFHDEITPIKSVDTAVTTLADPILTDSRAFEAKAFPNPTQHNSTIALDIEKEGQFEIVMYDMNGRMIQNIHSGELSSGRQQFEVDMYELNSGMYIVKIISQGQNETLKIQKVN